ncbi:hypothetical protein ColLi_12697 [Colletotrichum liriopes]|uniref:Uncharacterized protein n=1 Tax=Colletotrichum liriopes TaxID=708192 RepID=A0AA37LYY5_9PEZI|nr:hypothetical protein ColLi_12697 [Colletotrichum liriopes]
MTRLLGAKNHSTTTGMKDNGSGGQQILQSPSAASGPDILDMFSKRLLRETPDSFVDIIHKASTQLQRVRLSDTQAAVRGILDLARALGVSPSASVGDYGTGVGKSTPPFSHQPANDNSAPDDDFARDNALLRFPAEQRASQLAGMIEGLDVLREPVIDTQARLQDTITQLELLAPMIRNMVNTPLPSSLPLSSSSPTSTSLATAAPHNQSTSACLWFHVRDMVLSINDNDEAHD